MLKRKILEKGENIKKKKSFQNFPKIFRPEIYLPTVMYVFIL